LSEEYAVHWQEFWTAGESVAEPVPWFDHTRRARLVSSLALMREQSHSADGGRFVDEVDVAQQCRAPKTPRRRSSPPPADECARTVTTEIRDLCATGVDRASA
jgi:hypothetical protein